MMASILGMKHLGPIVRQLRLQRGLTLEALANQVPDYDSGNLSRFERQLQDIQLQKLEAIAGVLETPMHEIMRAAEGLSEPLVASETPRSYGGPRQISQVVSSLERVNTGVLQGVKRMPVLSDSQAARLTESDGELPQAAEHIEVAASEYPASCFAWRVKDDSMTSDGQMSFPPGMVVIFDRQAERTAGDCALVCFGEAEVSFVQLTRAAGSWFMTPLNRKYPPQPLPAAARIAGIAIGAHFKIPRGA